MSASFKLPSEAPVMTLPDTALFPHALLPLHIFEPRYRQMLADVLQGNRVFAVAGLDAKRAKEAEAEEPAFAVACLGMVRACRGNPDGTSNLVLQGMTRVRFKSVVEEAPYRRCAIELLASTPGAPPEELRRLRQELLKAIALSRNAGVELPEEALRFLRTLRDPETCIDVAVFSFCHDTLERQRLLEELDTSMRFLRFMRYLQAAAERSTLEKRLRGSLRDEDTQKN